jgi:hypothetical protein
MSNKFYSFFGEIWLSFLCTLAGCGWLVKLKVADFGKSFEVVFLTYSAHQFNLYRLTMHTINVINSICITNPVLWPFWVVLDFRQKFDITSFQQVKLYFWFLYGLKAYIFMVYPQLSLTKNMSKWGHYPTPRCHFNFSSFPFLFFHRS